MLKLRLVGLAFLFAVLNFRAVAFELSSNGIEAGSGPYLFSTTVASETDKSGLTAFAAFTKRKTFGAGYFYGGLGANWTAIEGQNESTVQRINQFEGLIDTSYLFEVGRFGVGAGLRHVLGPGAGNEFLKPNEFAWAVYGGPRISYEIPRSALTVNASFDRSFNLSAGTGSFILLSLAYRFEQEASGSASSTEDSQDAQSPLVEASTVEAPPKIVDRTFTARSSIVDFGRNRKKLTLRLRSYLQMISESLLGAHAREWEAIELRVPDTANDLSYSQATAIQLFLTENGIPSNRIRITRTNETPQLRLIVHSLNLGMVGYLEARDQTFDTGRIRYALGTPGKESLKRFSQLKTALIENAWAWKYTTIVVYSDGGASAREAIKSFQRSVSGSSRFDLIEIDATDAHVDLELDGVRDNQVLSRILSE